MHSPENVISQSILLEKSLKWFWKSEPNWTLKPILSFEESKRKPSPDVPKQSKQRTALQISNSDQHLGEQNCQDFEQ